MKLIKFAAAALVALSSLSASAGLITISGGTVLDVPVDNMFEATPGSGKNPSLVAGQEYNVGGNLLANVGGSFELTYNFLGQEAGWLNSFSAGGQTIDTQTNQGVVINTVQSYDAGDALDFMFFTLGYGSYTSNGNFVVQNGSNLAIGDKNYNFAIALNSTFKGVLYDAILFLDDTGWTKDDDNHDDLVIGLKVRAVPESSMLILMSLGLLGLAGARRLKN